MNQRPGGENLHIPLQITGDAEGLSSHSALLLIYYYLSMIVAIARAGVTAWAVVSCLQGQPVSQQSQRLGPWGWSGQGVTPCSRKNTLVLLWQEAQAQASSG